MTLSEPSRRDGHLSDLDLELVFAEPEGHAALRAHAQGCGECRARLAELEEEEAVFRALPTPPLAPSVTEVPPTIQPANRPWGVVLGMLAAVAVVALVVQVVPTRDIAGDEFRLKGGAVELEVFVHDGDAVRSANTSPEVHPGERLAFRVTPRHDGYLMVVGFDASGPYPCWPQRSAPDAESVLATGVAMDLDAAVRLDDRLGDERIVAVLCEQPIGWDDVIVAVGRGAAVGGCVSDEILLNKQPAP